MAQLLFQSPVSPAADPAFVEPPPPPPPPVEQPVVEPPPPPPVEQPVVEPAAPPPLEQPQLEQQSPLPLPDQPAPAPLDQLPEQPGAPPPVPEAGSTGDPAEPTAGDPSSLEPPPLPQPRPERVDRSTERDEEESRNLILDRAELVDTVVVSTAYVWLCCGIMLFLLIPLVFLFLQIRGRTKIKEEYL